MVGYIIVMSRSGHEGQRKGQIFLISRAMNGIPGYLRCVEENWF